LFKIGPQAHGQVNHLCRPGHHFGASREAAYAMARIGIVTFQQLGSRLADNMLGRGDHVVVDGPIIGVIDALGASDAFPEAFKGSMITATHHPGDTTPWATVIGFPNPTLVFFA